MTDPGHLLRGSHSTCHYEITVSSTASKAAARDGDVWSSGKITGSRQNVVAYGGEELAAQERYFRSVRTWGAAGAASAWSEPASFGTGPGQTWSDSVLIWASSSFGNWTDYTMETDFTVVQNAAAITFCTTSGSSFYLWQIRSDSNTLKTHTGTAVIEEVSLADKGITIQNGQTRRLRIEVKGTTVTTWIRTGSSEQATFDNLVVEDLAGKTLYSNDFESGSVPEMPTLAVAGVKTTSSAVQSNAFSLAFGVPPEAQKAPVAAAIKSRGMACSVRPRRPAHRNGDRCRLGRDRRGLVRQGVCVDPHDDRRAERCDRVPPRHG